MRWLVVTVLLSAWGCNCGTSTLSNVPQCANGTVTGTVCAPDLMTYVADATVTASGTCERKTFTQTTTTDSMGHFTLQMPAGAWTLTASTGSFSRTYMITVQPGQTTQIPQDQFCFKSNTTNLAVISGSGDHIETLLQNLGFSPTVYDGSSSGFSGSNGGLQLLKDPTELAKYNVLFIDCAAGVKKASSGGTSYKELDLGSDAEVIGQNLVQFVEKGGSLYASDWAFLYVYLAYPREFSWKTADGRIDMPFRTDDLMGYGPVTHVSGDVVDSGLAGYLGKSNVDISFPKPMNHWGLMDMVNNPATTLISGSVAACTDGTCMSGGSPSTEPLAALYRVTNGPGGAVAYTSFHNIDQTSSDVGQILKYLIFKL